MLIFEILQRACRLEQWNYDPAESGPDSSDSDDSYNSEDMAFRAWGGLCLRCGLDHITYE